MKVRELLEMFRLHMRVLKQLLISNIFLHKIKKMQQSKTNMFYSEGSLIFATSDLYVLGYIKLGVTTRAYYL